MGSKSPNENTELSRISETIWQISMYIFFWGSVYSNLFSRDVLVLSMSQELLPTGRPLPADRGTAPFKRDQQQDDDRDPSGSHMPVSGCRETASVPPRARGRRSAPPCGRLALQASSIASTRHFLPSSSQPPASSSPPPWGVRTSRPRFPFIPPLRDPTEPDLPPEVIQRSMVPQPPPRPSGILIALMID